jgi:hypothetical protein
MILTSLLVALATTLNQPDPQNPSEHSIEKKEKKKEK